MNCLAKDLKEEKVPNEKEIGIILETELDTEHTEVSTERTEEYRRKSSKYTIAP